MAGGILSAGERTCPKALRQKGGRHVWKCKKKGQKGENKKKIGKK